jgi:hypothetical protein
MITNNQNSANNGSVPESCQFFQKPGNVGLSKLLDDNWSTIFRNTIYPLLPVDRVARFYCSDNGRPTKDLATMLGLAVLQEIFDLTDQQVLDNLVFYLSFHYALNLTQLDTETLYICPRTYISFRHKLMNNEAGEDIFYDMTLKLAEKFRVDFFHQRMDSTHIFSKMKNAGRLAMMSATVKKFIHTLERRNNEAFMRLPAKLKKKYTPNSSGYDYFGRVEPSKRERVLKTVAQDMYSLINTFKSDPLVSDFNEYKLMVRVFDEQCLVENTKVTAKDSSEVLETATINYSDIQAEIEEEPDDLASDTPVQLLGQQSIDNSTATVVMKPSKEVKSDSVQFPSDPDAAYDGHKGKGYQAQICETYDPDKEPDSKEKSLQLITYARLEPANASDAAALEPALDKLQSVGMGPKSITCDTAYGSDSNCMKALEKGIEVLSPVSGKDIGTKNKTKDASAKPTENLSDSAQIDSFIQEFVWENELYQESAEIREIIPFLLSDFTSTEKGKILGCPMGQKALKHMQNKKKDGGQVYFNHSVCKTCERCGYCLVKISANLSKLSYRYEQVRISKRRAYQLTDEFKDRYRWRSGIEGTNSWLARIGIKRLRVRGSKACSLKVNFKALGLNLLRVIGYVSSKNEGKGDIKSKEA